MIGQNVIGGVTDASGNTLKMVTLGNTRTGQDETLFSMNGQLSPLDARPQGMAGRPWVGFSADPTPDPTQTPQGQDNEYVSVLNRQFDAQGSELDTHFSGQETAIRQHFQNLLENLHGEYQIERKYIEQTPMDPKQREAKVQQLNLKYEKAIYKLKSEAEPHFAELKQKRDAAMFQLESKRTEGLQRLQLVRELSDKGMITDPAAAVQEQLQVVGVSLPLTALKQPTQRRQLGDIQSELDAVSRALGVFMPNKKGKPMFDKRGNLLRNVRFSETGDEADSRATTAEERLLGDQLLQRRRELWQEKNDLLLQKNVGPMQRGMATAGNMQSTPFAKGVAGQMPKQASGPAPKYMTNKKTGQKAVSYDGGKTWQLATN